MRTPLIALLLVLTISAQTVRVPGPGGASPAAAGPALITSTNPATACAGNGSAAVVTLNMIGANAIIAVVAAVSGVSISSTNNPSGWVRARLQGSPGVEIWSKQNATISSSETVTASGTAVGLCVFAFSNMVTSGMDEGITNGSDCFGGATTCQPGSVTPGSGNQLIIVGQQDASTIPAPTLDGGFSSPMTYQSIVGGVSYSVGISYLIQSGSASANPHISYTSGGIGNGHLALAVFQGQ